MTGSLPGTPTPANPSLSTSADLQILRQGDTEAREILAGVYPGDLVALAVRGGEDDAVPIWTCSDAAKGAVSPNGVLQILAAGTFTVEVHAGSASQSLEVRAGSERPYSGVSVPPAEPTPSPAATPEATDSPVATASPDATPQATPLATPSPTPLPSPSPSPTPSGIPPSVPSDAFADEVISFLPGPGAGFGADDLPDIVLGPPQGNGAGLGGFHVLSLGLGGTIVLKSATPILDGNGPDLIVFENPFFVGGNPQSPFAEPGEVAVSQDGVAFFTFPCEADRPQDMYPGCAGVHPVYANPSVNGIDPTDPAVAGGDAFDLDELGLAWARYVRIRDLSTTGGGSSAGFDLDAIAIIHQ